MLLLKNDHEGLEHLCIVSRRTFHEKQTICHRFVIINIAATPGGIFPTAFSTDWRTVHPCYRHRGTCILATSGRRCWLALLPLCCLERSMFEYGVCDTRFGRVKLVGLFKKMRQIFVLMWWYLHTSWCVCVCAKMCQNACMLDDCCKFVCLIQCVIVATHFCRMLYIWNMYK